MLVQSVCGTSYKFANFFLFCYAHIYFFIYHFSEMISSFTIACVFTLVLLVTNASTHPILSNLFFQGKFFSYKSFHHCWLDSLHCIRQILPECDKSTVDSFSWIFERFIPTLESKTEHRRSEMREQNPVSSTSVIHYIRTLDSMFSITKRVK